MPDKTPKAFSKEGRSTIPLEESIKKFSEPLIQFPSGIVGFSSKFYTCFKQGKNPWLLDVSQGRDRLPNSYYSVIFQVCSYSDQTNQEVLKRFQREIGITLNGTLSATFRRMTHNLLMEKFLLFEQDPQEAIDFFKRISPQRYS